MRGADGNKKRAKIFEWFVDSNYFSTIIVLHYVGD